MQGVITTRDLVTSAKVIIHEFGVGVYVRCLAAVLVPRKVTFLEVIMRARRRQNRPPRQAGPPPA